jgi:membrane protein
MDLELWSRSLGFAALGFLTLVPLLLVVSSADPEHGRGFAQWLGEGLGVSAASREEIEELFARPGQAPRTTTVFGVATLALFGLAFVAAVQTGYEKICPRPAGTPGGGTWCGSECSSDISSCPPPPGCGGGPWSARLPQR